MAGVQLDNRQQEAVDHTFGPLLVIAGAGSGKTRVLTNRIARLIGEYHANPEEILAVTFTNKAAKEMRQRIANSLSNGVANKMTVCTFHSLGVKILREFGQYIGLKSDFKILSDNERESTLKTIMRSTGKRVGKESCETYGQEISLAKNGNLDSAAYLDEKPENRTVAKVYEAYHKVLKKRQAVDFDDLLLLPLKLFEEHKDILEKFRARYKFVNIDEFQDTNVVQIKLAKMLVAKHKNLMVVGDDDQGIYSWRGAKIENILLFSTLNKGTKTVVLNNNYRSTSQIVDGANAVVAKNSKRKSKDITAFSGKGEPIFSYKANDEDDEVEWIVEQIYQFEKHGEFRFRDFAILFRANAKMRRFEEELRTRHIPYYVQGGNSFFDRKEVKDIFSYLNFFANPEDEMSLLRMLKVPDKGIGTQTMEFLEDLAGLRKTSLWEAFVHYEAIDGIAPIQQDKLKNLVEFCTRYFERFEKDKPSLVLRDMLNELNYMDLIKKVYKDKKSLVMRVENIQEIIHAIELFEFRRKDEATLAEFIRYMDMKAGSEETENTKAVTLMTLHKSKGLEFPVVFMPILDDSIMPSKRALEEGLLEEERRLFYVGMTRAEKRLFLTFPQTKIVRQSRINVKESRFLWEIPVDCLNAPIGSIEDEDQKENNANFFAQMKEMLSDE